MNKKEKEHLQELKREARKYSIKDGIFSTIKDAVSGNYISPFAIAMNASNSLIAMISSMQGLIGPMSQWKTSRLIEKYPRKNIVLTSVFFEIFTWLPLILIALLFYFNIITNSLPILLIIFFAFYVITANAGTPAWFSWVGDIIDEEHRGRWFAKRTFIFSIISIICTVLSAFLLDYFKKINQIMIGFIILFSIAMLSRTISRYYLKKQYEPQIKIEKRSYFSLWKFIKKAPFNNFGRFTIFRALLNFSMMIAGPFFTIYMLRGLNFSYITWMTIVISGTVFSLIFIKAWGKFSDKYGNYEVFKITIILVALCPITWIFHTSPIYLILVPQLLSGIGWGGFNLAASNYIFDCVTPQKRALAVSYHELLNGIGTFAGATTGAILITKLSFMSINPIFLIFIISGIARLAVGIIMIPKIKEVRECKEFDNLNFIKKIFFRFNKHTHSHE